MRTYMRIIKRITALASAAAMLFSFTATAAEASPEPETYSEDELVRIVVQLYGDPVLAGDEGAMGADYLDTPEGRARAQELENLRRYALDEIQQLYPQAEAEFIYDSVFNGIAVTLPREMVDEAESLGAVKNVIVSEKNIEPMLDIANTATHTDDFFEDTGLTGEGNVIAVIDTELNTAADMFTPLSDSTKVKLTKADIENAVQNRGLNREIDPDRAYLSNKIPFAALYTNDEDIYAVSNSSEKFYHGTHVAGIAAGNEVQLQDSPAALHGAAPDAQLLFFGVFQLSDNSTIITESATIIAAMEDAVKLGADVINISLGSTDQSDDENKMYSEVIETAENAGVVICSSAGNESTITLSPETTDRNTVGDPAYQEGIFSVASAYIEDDGDTGISYFSSFGTPQSLILKPEISAPGESILSAGYDGYHKKSGTSMSSPYIAGCTALTYQYMESRGIALEGGEKTALAKALLMNSAKILRSNGMPLSPRSQGAGFVDMKALENCNVYMTSSGTRACAELGDGIDDTVSFDVTLKNIGTEDVVFSKADIELISDEVEELSDDTVRIRQEPRLLDHTSEIPDDILTIKAGEEKTVSVSAQISFADYEYLFSAFPNGCFIEGYLSLTGAENSSDISIPMIGYFGDFYAPPCFYDTNMDDIDNLYYSFVASDLHGLTMPASVSFSNLVKNYRDLYEDNDQMYKNVLRNEYVISQNNDDAFDDLIFSLAPARDCKVTDIEIYDENGEKVEGFRRNTPVNLNILIQKNIRMTRETPLEEGSYTAKLHAQILREGAEEHRNELVMNFTVDNTRPVITSVSTKEKNGRKILTITGQDKNLEGIYIIGNSTAESPYPLDSIWDVCFTMSWCIGAEEGNFNTASSISLVQLFEEAIEEEDEYEVSYFDVIPAEPDSEGSMTVEYDVTDLKDYTVTFADKGFNLCEYSPDRAFVGTIPSTLELSLGDRIIPDIKPEVSFDGKIISQGWEIRHGTDWLRIDNKAKAKMSDNGSRLRYYAETAGGISYSSVMTISITDVYRMKMEVYADNELIFSDETPPTVYDLNFVPFLNELRIELSCEGYVSRTILFTDTHNRLEADLYLCKKGDVDHSEKVDSVDIIRTVAHIKGLKRLDTYQKKVADVNDDGRATAVDVTLIAAKIKGLKNF